MADAKLTYTVGEVAGKLGISRNLAYRLARQKRLPGVIFAGARRMIVSRAKIDALLQSGEWQPPEG